MTLIACDLIAANLDVKLATLREWSRTRGVTAACDVRTRRVLYDMAEVMAAERAERIELMRHAITELRDGACLTVLDTVKSR